MEAPPPPNGAQEARDKKLKKPKEAKGSLIGSLVRNQSSAEMERKARKKAGKQEKKQEKKVQKLQKKERKAEAKGSALLNAEALALRTAFDQFIIAHRPIRRPGTQWEYLDVKPSSAASSDAFVFLPPGALRPEAYFELLTRMSQRGRVLAVVFPTDFTSLADYVAGVELILSHASIPKAHFFAIGFGGFVAHQLLAQVRTKVTLPLILHYGPRRHRLIHRRPFAYFLIDFYLYFPALFYSSLHMEFSSWIKRAAAPRVVPHHHARLLLRTGPRLG